MNTNQTNNDLQQAIEEAVAEPAAPTSEAAAGDAAAELENAIQGQMGTPPMPPMPGEGEMPEMTLPETAKEVAAETAAPVETVAVEETVTAPSGDLAAVKVDMLRDLFPIMDKINVMPEQKVKIYRQMIDSTGDKNMIPAAYEAVKQLTDDAAKAEMLLYLVEKTE